jgi:hypothetical protein
MIRRLDRPSLGRTTSTEAKRMLSATFIRGESISRKRSMGMFKPGKLLVTVHKGLNLKANNRDGLSDGYAILSLEGTEHKTKARALRFLRARVTKKRVLRRSSRVL